MFPLVAGSAAATAALEQADVQTNEENVSERVAHRRGVIARGPGRTID